MIVRFAIAIALISTLTGCVTTGHSADISQLQMRVSFIENQFDDQARDLEQIKSSVEDISARMQSMAVPTEPEREERKIPAPLSPAPKIKYQQVLRVPVTPQKVQAALQNAGYYSGAIDGKLGPRSKKAIKDFQKDHDLESDGIVGKKTWTELRNYLD